MRLMMSFFGLPHKVGLMAGKAPANWEVDLGREAARRNDLSIGCRWIGLWQNGGEIRLCRAPLFGSALEELVGSGHSNIAGEESLVTLMPRWKGNIRPDLLWPCSGNSQKESSKLDSLKQKLHEINELKEKAWASGIRASPLKMQKRAGRTLLTHLAGEASLANVADEFQPGIVISVPNFGTMPIVPWNAEMQHAWQRNLAVRAIRSLLHGQAKDYPASSAFEAARTALPSASEDRAKINKQTAPIKEDNQDGIAEIRRADYPSDQWAVALDGPGAPQEMLLFLAAPSNYASKIDRSQIRVESRLMTGPGGSLFPNNPDSSDDIPEADQRTLSLEGQASPSELLSYLAGSSTKGWISPVQSRRSDSVYDADSSNKEAEPSYSSQHLGRRGTTSRGVAAILKTSQVKAKRSEMRFEASSVESSGWMEDDYAANPLQTKQDSAGVFEVPASSLRTESELMHPLIAPLRSGPILPDFLMPHTMLQWPAASANARAGAKLEKDVEGSEEDDKLRILAAQIKRILDEEARRHGIDV